MFMTARDQCSTLLSNSMQCKIYFFKVTGHYSEGGYPMNAIPKSSAQVNATQGQVNRVTDSDIIRVAQQVRSAPPP